MAITIQQLENSKTRARELRDNAREAERALNDSIKGLDVFESTDAQLEHLSGLSDALDVAKRAHRLEQIVFSGLSEEYLNKIELGLLERMAADAEKFDGQKIHFKRPARMIVECAEALGVNAYVSEHSGCVVVYTADYCERRIYVCPGSWEGSSFVHRFDAARIRELHELAVAKAEESLTEDEIRAQAHEMLAEIEELEAEKKKLAEKIDDVKDKYRRVFGYEIRELEDL